MRRYSRPSLGHSGPGRRRYNRRYIRAAAAAKISLSQATKFAESLARGEPDRAKIAGTVLSDKVRELIERRRANEHVLRLNGEQRVRAFQDQ
jgi:hypothetical protein